MTGLSIDCAIFLSAPYFTSHPINFPGIQGKFMTTVYSKAGNAALNEFTFIGSFYRCLLLVNMCPPISLFEFNFVFRSGNGHTELEYK